ncbi:MAG: 5-formyltetrahydrofolate cyclo-ligase [Rubrobacteraceae bacterium]
MTGETEMLRETKSRLRREVLHRRDTLTESKRAAGSAEILRKVRGLAAYREANVVLAYSSFGSELRTAGFLRSVLEEGKTLALPRIDREKKLLNLHAVRNLDEDLEPGVWGIREPGADLPAVDLAEVDIALVPGVAFDARGGRLGHGAGFYDRLLGSSKKRPLLVAGAFEVQMVEGVLMAAHDIPMDLVATESRFCPGINQPSR